MASLSPPESAEPEPIPVTRTREPTLGDFGLYLWRLSRPEVWLVSVVPMYVGFVLASRSLVPGFHLWAGFWSAASFGGLTTRDFLMTFQDWALVAWPFLLACVVMGPLVWAATLLINDVHDLAGDRRNPRKARSPLVQGLVSQGWAHTAAYACGALALGLALLVGPTFALLTAGALALAWAYSAPPLRLKTRPGADVLLNAVGVGALCALAGWSLARPLAEAPWAFLPQGILVAAAVYVPTTLVDHDADVASGYSTFATRLGRSAAYQVGFACWTLANVGALLLSYAGFILPRAMLPLLLVFAPLLVYQYHAFIGRARDGPEMVKGVILCCLTFAAVNTAFVLMYTGMWRPA